MAVLDQTPGGDPRLSNAGDSRPSSGDFGETNPPVELAVSPASHLWIAGCLGLGGAFLLATLFHSLGTLLMFFEHLALEALFSP